MSELIIDVVDLCKTFKVQEKQEGFLASVKSLFYRKYKLVNAVTNVNLKVNKGEIRGLIGPNGAGKSTTIKMLCGILHPTSGDVKVMNYVPWLERNQYVKQLGAVFGQKSQLLWDLPAIDSFSLNKEMYRIPDHIYIKNVAYLTELLQIGEVINKPVRQISLGERMKCELVIALLHEPPLIFLDEPTIGLDIISKETIRGFIKKLNKEKKTTIIITTHDLADLEDLCDNVTIINKGTVVYDDSLDQLKKFFANKKIIEIKFSTPVELERLASFNVISRDNFWANIEIDLDENNLETEVSRIFSTLPIHDINISSIPIEQVIKQIYTS